MAVEIGGYAGAELVSERGRGVESAEHLVGNLRVAGFVGAHQAQSIAAQERRKAVGEKEYGEKKKNGCFADGGPTGQPFGPAFGRFRSRGFQSCFHFQRFSSSSVSLEREHSVCSAHKKPHRLWSQRLGELTQPDYDPR